MREPQPQYEESSTGVCRVIFEESKLIAEDLRPITIGPWCVSRQAAEQWWATSETAREMRDGRRRARA